MPRAQKSPGSPPAARAVRRLRAACGSRRPARPSAIPLALVWLCLGTVAVEVAAVFNNAMIPRLVPPGSVTARLVRNRMGDRLSRRSRLARGRARLPRRRSADGPDLLGHRPALWAHRRCRRSRGRPRHGSLLGDLVPRLRHAALLLHARSRRSKRPAAEAVREGLRQVQTRSPMRAATRASGASSSPTWSTRTRSSPCSRSAASTAPACSAGGRRNSASSASCSP